MKNLTNSNNEIVWIDWVKCICMVLVYWDHTLLYGNNEAPFIIPFRPFFVNAFFFVSGYLLFRKQFLPCYIQLDRRSFISYLLTSTGGVGNILFKLIIPTIIFSIALFFPARIIRGDDIYFGTFLFDCFIVGGNWFTCALAVSELIIYILLISRSQKFVYYILSTFALAVIAVVLQDRSIYIFGNEYAPWFYKSGMIASLFLVLGGVYHKYETVLDKYNIIYCVLFILLMINFNQDTIPMSTWAGINAFGFSVSMISILSVISLCKRLPPNSIVQWVSRHSIGFYFLSAAVPFACIRICNLFLRPGYLSFFCQMIISFAIAYLFTYLLNKIVPFLFDIRKIFKKQS